MSTLSTQVLAFDKDDYVLQEGYQHKDVPAASYD